MLLTVCVLSSCGKQAETVEQTQVEYTESNRYTEKADGVTKTETVYVNLDSSGMLRKITVSDWIHTEKGGVYVDDISILDNIKNAKGNESPQIDGEKLRWHMDEKDLYYYGTTNKTPPVLFDVEYYLDGNKMNPQDIAGKSGEILIRITIRNNLFKEITVNGRKNNLTLPTAVIGGMILPGNVFSDIKTENAQSFNDGAKQLVYFATIPGMNGIFGFEDNSENGFTEFLTADVITVTARAENFILENMYFAVIPLATLNYDMMMPESVGDAGTALNAIRAFRDAMQRLDPDRVIYSLISDEAKVNSLIKAVNDASDLYEKNQNLIGLVGKYSTPENIEAMRRLIEILNTPEVKAMLEVISDPEVQSFITGLPVIMENFGDVEPLMNELQKDLSRAQVQKELSDLPRTMKTLADIMTVFSENEKEIDALFNALDGNGSQSLESLLESIDSEEIQSLEDKYGDIVDESDLLVTVAEEWFAFGREYGLFTGKTDEMNFSLIFIYKTESIRSGVS